jgi:hypothetical protein
MARRRDDEVAGGRRIVWWTSFAGFAFLTLVWSVTIPLMSAPDEPSHAVKAAMVARGDLETSSENAVGNGAVIPQTMVTLPTAYLEIYWLSFCYANNRGPTVECARTRAVRGDGPPIATSTYVGAYQPVYYAIVGWPSRLLSARHALYLMRAVGALTSAALLASGISSAVAAGQRRVLVTVAALGITPMVTFLTGSINPNGLEIAAAFCVWLAALDLLTTRTVTTRLLARVGVSSVVLAWCRPLSPAFLVIIVATVAVIAADRPGLTALWHDSRVRIVVGIVAAATAASAVFVVVNHSLTTIITHPPADPPSHLALARTSFSLTGTRIEQMIGVLGPISFSTPHLPRWLVDAWEAAIVATAALALVVGTWRHRLVLAMMIVGVIALPVVSETLEGARYGANWQGRYALPLAVGLPILAGWVIDTSGALPRIAERWGATLLAAALAVGWLVAQASVIARAVHGRGTTWTRAFGAEPWAGPFGPRLLLTAGLAATLSVSAWFVASSWGWPRPDSLQRRAWGTEPSTARLNG